MSVYLAHGVSQKEIEKYNTIFEYKDFSVAEYYSLPDKEPMLSFQHSHDEYEFIFPLRTIPLLRYQKANYIGEVGYCYPVNPEVNHGIEFDLEESHVISITVSKKLMETRKEKLGFVDNFFYTRFLVEKDLMLAINKFQQQASKEYPNKMLLDIISKSIIDMIITDGLSSGKDNRKPEKVYAKNIKNIIIYMFENYSDPELTIASLADRSGYSLAYFSRAFKAYMHETPITHLNKLRLSEARELFKNKNLSLGDIATKVGYRNLSTFTEAFKKIIGMKPKKYREKYY